MTATIQNSYSYSQPIVYPHEWLDDENIRLSWLSRFKIHSIPEENDPNEFLNCTYSDTDSDSDESLLSNEHCYVVVETRQLPSLVNTQSTEIERQLKFAQIIENDHHGEDEQCAETFAIEMPLIEHAVEYQLEHLTSTHRSKNIVIHVPTVIKNSNTVSNQDSFKSLNIKPNPQSILKPTEQRTLNKSLSPETNESNKSNLSKPHSRSTSTTTTFANLSSQCKFNHVQIQREQSINETITSARTLPFYHEYIEKSNVINDEQSYSIESNNTEEIVHPFYLINKPSTDAALTISTTSTESTPFRRLIKKTSRRMKSDYYLSSDQIKSREPCLLQVRYLDGRPTLTNNIIRESPKQSICSSKSTSLRSNLSKLVQPDGISPSSSYRKRLLNHFQNLLKPHSTERLSSRQPRSVLDLFFERKK